MLRDYPPLLRWLALGAVINSIGMAFLWPLTTTYVHLILGESLAMAGLVILLNQAASLAGNLIGGYLFDRRGPRAAVLVGLIPGVVMLALMAVWQDFYPYAALMTLYGLFWGISFPCLNALVTVAWPEGGRRAINFIYVAHNLGVAIGSGLGGFLASHSFRWAFLGSALMTLTYLGLFLAVLHRHGPRHRMKARRPQEGSMGGAPSGLMLVALGMTLSWIVYIQWQSTIAIHMQSLGVSLALYSTLWTANGAVILLGQPPLNWMVRRWMPHVKKQIIVGTVIFGAAMVVASLSGRYGSFLCGMVLMTLGEMLIWPGVPTLAAQMAPPGREGRYQGIIMGASSAGRMVGPVLGGVLYETASAMTTFYVMVGICGLVLLCFGAIRPAAASSVPHPIPLAPEEP
ncbi:MAG: MFS transporter [Planctomycetes bacterium]|nr:MFS transporter [Planctomycetota bacterium]